MQFLPIRLSPGADLRRALEEVVGSQGTDSAFVVAGIGSLVEASLRYAGEAKECTLAGPLEVVSVSGSLSPMGAHLPGSPRHHRSAGFSHTPRGRGLVGASLGTSL